MSVNLSAWAIRNRTLVRYAMLVLALIGIFSYQHLGQSEDPPFTFKVMVVRTFWPGATAAEVSQQVTDRIEKKLLETGQYEFIRSYSQAGRIDGDVHGQGFADFRPHAGAVVPGAQESRRHQADLAAGRARAVLQ